MFDADSSGSLHLNELKDVLRAIDIDVDKHENEGLLTDLLRDVSGNANTEWQECHDETSGHK